MKKRIALFSSLLCISGVFAASSVVTSLAEDGSTKEIKQFVVVDTNNSYTLGQKTTLFNAELSKNQKIYLSKHAVSLNGSSVTRYKIHPCDADPSSNFVLLGDDEGEVYFANPRFAGNKSFALWSIYSTENEIILKNYKGKQLKIASNGKLSLAEEGSLLKLIKVYKVKKTKGKKSGGSFGEQILDALQQ